MSPPLIATLVVGFLAVVWFISNYNGLVRLRQHCRESWAQIDTELRRRYDLIPNLVAAVKGYARHEREVLETVTKARSQAQSNHESPTRQAEDENVLVGSLRRLLVVAEDYPELKADRNFRALQDELVITEDRIQAARRFYNGNVRDYNTRIAVVPSNLIAAGFGFGPEEFFEVEHASVRRSPDVDLDE